MPFGVNGMVQGKVKEIGLIFSTLKLGLDVQRVLQGFVNNVHIGQVIAASVKESMEM